MEKITVACIQQRMSIQPSHEDFEAQARRFLRQAAAKGAHVTIFPELAGVMVAPPLISSLKLGLVRQQDESKRPEAGLVSRMLGRVAGGTASALGGGFRGSLERLVRKRSDAFLDAYMRTFGGLAREYGMVIVGGSLYIHDPEIEMIRSRVYVFNVDGEVLGYQDKLNLAPAEANLASPGEDVTVVETRFGRLGLLIGRDILFPELARLLATRGADLLVGVAAISGAPAGAITRKALSVRAEENQLFTTASFMLGPNYLSLGTAEEFYGKSAVLAPISITPGGTGALVEAGTDRTEAIIAAELDFSALEALHETSGFRPRQQMHLGETGDALAEFYGSGRSIEEAVEQGMAAIAAPAPEPAWIEGEPTEATAEEPAPEEEPAPLEPVSAWERSAPSEPEEVVPDEAEVTGDQETEEA